MEVLTLGAGAGKGLVVLPDAGDAVLVLLDEGDPARGLVLGGLYGPRPAPDAGGVRGGAVRSFALLTAGGQTVRLDDDLGGVRVEDRSGSVLELGPGAVRLHAAADLEISAPGRRIVLRAAAVDMETA
jgi:uncharacterized protein involved in type VI secretion and phage assembly